MLPLKVMLMRVNNGKHVDHKRGCYIITKIIVATQDGKIHPS